MTLDIKCSPPGGLSFDGGRREAQRQSYFLKEMGYSAQVGL